MYSCRSSQNDTNNGFHFSLLRENKTNIDFNNKLTESDSVNFLINQYIYIGSGVGIGDFNKDGLQDIFFPGSQVSSKLYINKGDFKFEDVTANAGLQTNRWCTGVSIIDINNDGLSDIYVCVSHSQNPEQRRNLLFINQGNLKFTEQAKDYGLDDAGFSTQAAFLDYDKDGDLDMYLMNHNVFRDQPNNITIQDTKGSIVATDRMYRNEGVPDGKNHPVFKDVSVEVQIRDVGYGLGVVITDFNNDNWPDIYVANDFLSNDLLWLNNKNSTFQNCIGRSLRHQSYNSMGVDAADINNDLLPDIAVLDMQPEINYRKKTMFAGSNPERYEMEQKIGGHEPQFTRNTLQLHQGNRIVKDAEEPFFSEIGQLSGISETDWSWAVLMADFDNDGWKDIHVTNGITKDLTNNDFLFFRHSGKMSEVSDLNPKNSGGNNDNNTLRKQLDSYGTIKTDNYFFHNNGDLRFKNVTSAVGMAVPSVSHGSAQVDLDNDGDLDLVINNMNQEAFIWRNELRKTPTGSSNNFLTVQLKGDSLNKSGVGVKAILYGGGKTQLLEQYPVRGFLSSVDERLHFGVGNFTQIDSLKVIWPDNSIQVLKSIKSNQLLTVKHENARHNNEIDTLTESTLFVDAQKRLDTFFRHNEVSFFDYGKQRLLPQKYSQLGPPSDTGDVNGDGLTDFFIGGGTYQSGKIFIQLSNGNFSSRKLVEGEKVGEDAGAVFFDCDGDQDVDLLIAQGSLEFGNSPTLNIPRLYKNDGLGNFTIDENAVPAGVSTISQAVTAGDYDSDGDKDIFIGGRMLPDQYPLSPRSYILQNNNGKFSDVTKEVNPILEKPGLITAAVWTDFDNDKKQDLIICGEWMPVRFFKNTNNKLEEVTANTGLTNMNGLWRSLLATDIDRDGDVDIVAGNMGLNNKYHVSKERPSMLYAKDIDGNGSIDLVPAYHIKNSEGNHELFPAIDRTQFAEEVLTIKKKYLLNVDYAKVNMKQLLNDINPKDMIVLKCETNTSVWIENLGNGIFTSHSLPVEAQFAPVNAIVSNDFDYDGNIDLLIGGNEYEAEVTSGRYDASYGLLLKNKGAGRFEPVRPVKSGFIVEGDTKSIKCITNKKSEVVIIAVVNNGFLKCFKISPSQYQL